LSFPHEDERCQKIRRWLGKRAVKTPYCAALSDRLNFCGLLQTLHDGAQKHSGINSVRNVMATEAIPHWLTVETVAYIQDHPATQDQKMINVIIVEPMPVLKRYLRSLIARRMAEIADVNVLQADSAEQARLLIKVYCPEHVILGADVSTPDALSLASLLWLGSPDATVLVWDRIHQAYKLQELLRLKGKAGRVAYVMQTSMESVLVEAIDALFNERKDYFDPVVKPKFPIDTSGKCTLTSEEFDALQDVVLGLTDKAVAAKHNLGLRTAQYRIASAANKLGLRKKKRTQELYSFRVQLVLQALRSGMFLLEDLLVQQARCGALARARMEQSAQKQSSLDHQASLIDSFPASTAPQVPGGRLDLLK
jgi:DNA-binding NarL/FixJ family response regulator